MPRAHDAALEKRERRFHSVCMHVAVSVFARVVNGLMEVLLHLVERVRIDSRFIGQNHFDMAANVGVDDFLNSLGLRIPGANQPQVSIALPDADNNRYVAFCAPTAFLARNVGFVYLNRAAKFLRCYFQHGRPDAMAEVPCRLVADSKRALNLAGGATLFGLADRAGW